MRFAAGAAALPTLAPPAAAANTRCLRPLASFVAARGGPPLGRRIIAAAVALAQSRVILVRVPPVSAGLGHTVTGICAVVLV